MNLIHFRRYFHQKYHLNVINIVGFGGALTVTHQCNIPKERNRECNVEFSRDSMKTQ